MTNKTIERPKLLSDIVIGIESLQDFGYNLRDWQHEMKGVSSKAELINRLEKEPALCAELFEEGKVADAYLAAYAAYLCDLANVPRPEWTFSEKRILQNPWFSHSDKKLLLVHTPSSFKEHNVFTEPENVLNIRKGRPRLSQSHKNRVNALRQKRYRERIKQELQEYRSGK